jgi:glyoxylase-like metal-dependent hydrolase (beta-lactamase superfamily II)
MPQIYRLGEFKPSLKEISLIIGDGLCSNIYVLGKKEVTIVDTGVGNKANPIFPQLVELGVHPKNIKQVILTHAHHDHAMGTYLILENAVPKIYVHEKDTRFIASTFGEFLVKVNEGDIIDTSIGSFKVYWTPGHTSGSMCLYNKIKKILISGDTVFPDGYYGRYDGEEGSLDAIVESLRKLTKLDCEVMLPGHGSPVFQDANSHVSLSYSQASKPR